MKTGTFLLGLATMLLFSPSPGMSELTSETTQNHVFFAQGGKALDATALAQIETLGQVLATPPLDQSCFRLVGFSDASGGAQVNRTLSLARAEVVAAELEKRLDRPGRILEIEGMGADGFLAEIEPTDPFQRRVAIMARDCR